MEEVKCKEIWFSKDKMKMYVIMADGQLRVYEGRKVRDIKGTKKG